MSLIRPSLVNKEKKAAKKKAKATKKAARKSAKKTKKAARKKARSKKKDARKTAKKTKKAARKKAKAIKKKATGKKAKKAARKKAKSVKKKARKMAKATKKKVRKSAKATKKTARKSAKSIKKKARKTGKATVDATRKNKGRLKLTGILPHLPKKWSSYLDFQQVDSKIALEPTNVKQVRKIVEFAVENKRKIRVVGSGHSFSNILKGNDILLHPRRLSKVTVLDGKERRGRINKAFDKMKLAEVGAGTTIRELDNKLEKKNLGMINQGTYEGQRIWGAVSTSTHGSGIDLGAFPDLVQSVLMVVDTKHGVKTYRIERKNGPTSPRFKEKDVDKLIKDDDTFNAVICGMGVIGVAVSLIVKVRKMYYLREKGKLTHWGEVKRRLENAQEVQKFCKNARHSELLVSPYKSPDYIQSTLTGKQDLVSERLDGRYLVSEFHRTIDPRNKNRGKCPVLLMNSESLFDVNIIDNRARLNFVAGYKIRQATHVVVGPYCESKNVIDYDYDFTRKYHKTLPRGGKKIGGFAFEIFMPLDKIVPVMEECIAKMNDITTRSLKLSPREPLYSYINDAKRSDKKAPKDAVFFGPIGVRFIAPSESLMSPMAKVGREQKQAWCSFEITHIYKKSRANTQRAAMKRLEKYLLEKFPFLRVHWGLELDYIGEKYVKDRYKANFVKWKKIQKDYSFHKTFNNAFTKRIGIN